jgi:hypothetical protein
MVQEQGKAGQDDAVHQLHARCQCGELTFRAIAAALGLSMRELYDLFE